MTKANTGEMRCAKIGQIKKMVNYAIGLEREAIYADVRGFVYGLGDDGMAFREYERFYKSVSAKRGDAFARKLRGIARYRVRGYASSLIR
ncbi:MAG: hypothetical protein LBL73_05330 [Synergistaceae bacterium]|nr:hypothetical protein [Synergistaceae bacterium]